MWLLYEYTCRKAIIHVYGKLNWLEYMFKVRKGYAIYWNQIGIFWVPHI